ncbi:MAG: hypothetical protein PWQ79_804 [Thermococcaceae archaeon]|nr:hypothetical protein [Thermococcaceae archaeon]
MGVSSESVKATLREILKRMSEMNVREILSYWIEGELDEAEMYEHLANVSKEVVWDPEIPEVFLKLSEDSLQHAETLLKVYRKLFPGENLVEVDLPAVEVVLSKDKLTDFLNSGRLEDLFDILMETERLTMEIYRYLSDIAKDPQVKEVAKWLADIEEEHYNHLRKVREKFQKSDKR